MILSAVSRPAVPPTMALEHATCPTEHVTCPPSTPCVRQARPVSAKHAPCPPEQLPRHPARNNRLITEYSTRHHSSQDNTKSSYLSIIYLKIDRRSMFT